MLSDEEFKADWLRARITRRGGFDGAPPVPEATRSLNSEPSPTKLMAAWKQFRVGLLLVCVTAAGAPSGSADTPFRACAGLAFLTFSPPLGVVDQEGDLVVSPYDDPDLMNCLEGAVPCDDPDPLACVPAASAPNPNLTMRYAGNCVRATISGGLSGVVVGGSVLSARGLFTMPEGPLLVGLTGSLLAEGENPCSMSQATCACVAKALGPTPG